MRQARLEATCCGFIHSAAMSIDAAGGELARGAAVICTCHTARQFIEQRCVKQWTFKRRESLWLPLNAAFADWQ